MNGPKYNKKAGRGSYPHLAPARSPGPEGHVQGSQTSRTEQPAPERSDAFAGKAVRGLNAGDGRERYPEYYAYLLLNHVED